MKRKLMVGFLVLSIILINAFSVSAATWAVVSVDYLGPNANKNVIVVTDAGNDPAVFTEKWFKMEPGMAKEMLAVALTAITMEKTLTIRIMDDGVTIDTMYLE